MEYNYEDASEVPDLEVFKEDLVEDIFKAVFFQQRSTRKYNMLKLPIISAPSLLRKQVNNDIGKKSLMEKEFKYTEETLATFMEMVDTKEIKISGIPDLKGPELTELSKKLGTYAAKKSAELLRTDLINLSKIFLAGQVLSDVIDIFMKVWYLSGYMPHLHLHQGKDSWMAGHALFTFV